MVTRDSAALHPILGFTQGVPAVDLVSVSACSLSRFVWEQFIHSDSQREMQVCSRSPLQLVCHIDPDCSWPKLWCHNCLKILLPARTLVKKLLMHVCKQNDQNCTENPNLRKHVEVGVVVVVGVGVGLANSESTKPRA